MTIFHSITKFMLFGIVFIFLLPNVYSQLGNAKNDSLKLELQNAMEDTSKMNVLIKLIHAHFDADIATAKSYAFQHLSLAENTSDVYRTADSYLILSKAYYRNGNIDSMEFFAQKALDFLDNKEHDRLEYLEMQAYARLGIVAGENGNNELALKYFQKSGSRMTNQEDIIRNEFNVGSIMLSLGDYNGSLESYSKAREFSLKIGDKQFEAIALKNIGSVYAKLNENEKALDYIKKSLKLKEEIGDEHGMLYDFLSIAVIEKTTDLEKALISYQSLLDKSRFLKNENFTVVALNGLTKINLDLGNIEKALSYKEECYQILQNYPDGHIEKNTLFYYWAEILNAKEKYSEALEFSNKAINGFEIADGEEHENFIDALHVHLKTLYFTGNTEEGWKVTLLRDSLITARNTEIQKEATAAAEVKLRLREKELEFEKGEQESELQLAKSEGRKNLFLSLLGGTGLLLFLGFFFNRRTRNAKKEIEIQKKLVDQSLVEKEVLLKEIHHRVKNNLQIISSLLDEQARASSNEQLKKMMKEGQNRVQSMALIHQNLYESENLASIEIKAYINELMKNITKSQIGGKDVVIELNVDDTKLDIDAAIPIGLILNELITNSYKYAFVGKETGKITIDFKGTKDREYAMKIKDNGIGLPTDFNLRKSKSLGMNLVEGLVRQLDGTMNFSDSKDGTEFQLQF